METLFGDKRLENDRFNDAAVEFLGDTSQPKLHVGRTDARARSALEARHPAPPGWTRDGVTSPFTARWR